jgi:signal transduction histidine kinase
MQNGLNVVMGRAQLLEQQLSDPDHVAHATDIFEWSKSISDLSKKVRSVLDTVADEDDATRKPVDMTPVVTEEAARVDAMSDRVDVGLDVPESVEVLANDLLSDVVGNLLTNAVEHTEESTRVDVTVEESGPSARLQIHDDGPGVPEERREAVFERGEQRAGSAGSGFGLYFVSSMVDSYGGDVYVEESDRGGAAFVLELPRA